jgi:type IV pilus assembly protein PilZ
MPKRSDRRRSLTPVSVDRRGSDRRQHERVVVDIEVDYRADDTFLFAYITDISAMGIFVQTNTPEEVGTRLNLCFRMPPSADGEGRMLELEGEVTWINPQRPDDPSGRNPGMGIRFVNLEDEDRADLMRMVRTFAFLDDEPPEPDEDLIKPVAKA